MINFNNDELKEDIKIYSKVASLYGITEESNLELTISPEGIIIDLYEVTNECMGSNQVCTRSFCATFEELIELLR